MYLGLQEDGRFSLNNHLRFTILYHRDIETDLARIVGFEVEPFSVKHKYSGKWNADTPSLTSCNPGGMKFVTDKDEKQELKEGQEIIFTYDVSFKVLLFSFTSSGKACPVQSWQPPLSSNHSFVS